MTLIFTNTNTSRAYLTQDIVTNIAKFTRVKSPNFHQFRKQNRFSKLSSIKLASFFKP